MLKWPAPRWLMVTMDALGIGLAQQAIMAAATFISPAPFKDLASLRRCENPCRRSPAPGFSPGWMFCPSINKNDSRGSRSGPVSGPGSMQAEGRAVRRPPWPSEKEGFGPAICFAAPRA